MFTTLTRRPTPVVLDPNPGWSRGRLLVVVVGGLAATAVLLVTGVALAVQQTLTPTPPVPTIPTASTGIAAGPATDPVTSAVRDAAAAAGWPAVPTGPDASLPPAVPPQGLSLPAPSVLRGQAGVAAGFPPTGEGAVAQLAAIDELVLTTMQPQTAIDVFEAWAAPDAGDGPGWALTRHVTAFNAALARAGAGPASVQARPVAGLVRAVDGPDWVVACVLVDVRATVKTEARLGFGHCERLQWDQDRWVIAPGSPPTPPAVVTPGTAAAAHAGWRPFTTTP